MRSARALSLFVAAWTSTLAVQAATLQYNLAPGSSFTYSVRIEADEPKYVDVLQGNITLTAGAAPVGEAGSTAFKYEGALVSRQEGKDGSVISTPLPSRLSHLGFGVVETNRQFRLDSLGRAAFPPSVRQVMPCVLGSIPRLLFDRLPPGNPTTWEMTDDGAIFIQSPAASAPTILPARERITYTLGDAAGDTVQIGKHYELKTEQLVGGQPRIRITGDGQMIFDTKIGLPRSTRLQGTLATTSAAGTESTPLVVTTSLVQNAGGTPPSSTPPMPVAPQPPLPASPNAIPLKDAERASLLADLKENDQDKKLNAANRLGGVAPDAHAVEVSQALTAVLLDPDLYVRQAAARALGVWGKVDGIPALLTLLDDKEYSVRWAVMDALGSLRAPNAAAAIARKLASEDRFKAAPALEKIGPSAANVVLPYLKDKDWTARLEACHILQAIGSLAQLPPLQALAADESPFVRTAASEAVKAIRGRG